MSETNNLRSQNNDVDVNGASDTDGKPMYPTRREFIGGAIAATSAIALSELVPASVVEAAPQASSCVPTGSQALAVVTEITSNGTTLQALMRVANATKNVPTSLTAAPTQMMLRYFEGTNPVHSNQKWPPSPSQPGPGPTLRCGIGDTVNITLLNHVKVQDFGGSLDSGEEGRGEGCDQATKVNADGTTNKNWYPDTDKYPDCLHGSSSANLHFHGTHVTPSTTGDNILVNIRPNPKVTEKEVKTAFNEIFANCHLGHQPTKWQQLPKPWRDFQETLLKEYDKTAPYQGGHGLPEHLQLWPQNEEAIAEGVWPQWYIGSYPYCFQIPKYEEDSSGRPIGVKMGQAPGTHWYHSHKHGSTAINLFNGLSGALIITDNSPTGYDGKLKAFYNNKLQEVVLVFQQITAAPNLLSAAAKGPTATLVNGQFTPYITMQPGQIQLFRLINATVQGFVSVQFNPLTAGAPAMPFRQTAQDGVQLDWKNYSHSQNGSSPLTMAPANRVDVLVQAPTTPGCYVLGTTSAPVAYINVTGTAINPPMVFPTSQSDYPKMPNFLKDIDPATIRLRREVVYGWEPGREQFGPGRVPHPPHYTIDGKQFEDQIIDQVMLLDSAEEWTISNTTTAKGGGPGGIQHPFHIHVNPFQITEVFDPSTMTQPLKLEPPYVWWDTFAIPAGSNTQPDGKTPRLDPVTGKQVVVPGYFKMRSRFVDFTGLYVNHCHILPHEDRGMMQLVEVVTNRTLFKHH
ncbi:MAG TPA: multicopper oxidase domain-containing protein [Blastocatellia bacterium]|nr:multicopper oxidase domain-containing protein [Blastocatellia bacterium]